MLKRSAQIGDFSALGVFSLVALQRAAVLLLLYAAKAPTNRITLSASWPLSEAEIEALADRYAKECVPLIVAARQAERASQKRRAETEMQRSACDTERKVLGFRRTRWAQLTEADRIVVMAVEKDMANGYP